MKTYDERSTDVLDKMNTIKRKRRIRGVALGLCLSLVLLVLFVPYNTAPPSVARYSASPYYDLITKINAATYDPPEYKNNFDFLTSSLTLRVNDSTGGVAEPEWNNDGDYSDDLNFGAPMPEESVEDSVGSQYVEVTDNQVEGVIEADIFKRTGTHLYYLSTNVLSVYSIAGEESALLGTYTLDQTEWDDEKEETSFWYYGSREMYLSADGKTVTIINQGAYGKALGGTTVLISLDVSDPYDIREVNRIYISGEYLSSRMVDGQLLIMSKYRLYNNSVDFEDDTTFVPQVGTKGDMELILPEDIVSPEELTDLCYTVICSVDGSTLQISDTAAFLSYSDDIYVSADRIYASRTYTHRLEDQSLTDEYSTVSTTMTEIVCIGYSGGGLQYEGSVCLEGTVLNQYSMDEYDGLLRVVTSVSAIEQKSSGFGTASARTVRSASLYCVSLENFSIAGSVLRFAPEGESVESVRFNGNMAYVCTAEIVYLTDPVFFFDLTDPTDITWTDTGTIDGYSTSLIDLGEGFLLGVGYGGEGQLKIEIYEERKDTVVSVCAYEADASFSEAYKSYLVDRENNLFGLALNYWDTGMVYVLLHFNGYGLHELAAIPLEGNAASNVRAVIIDEYLYVLSYGGLSVEKLW